MYKPFLAVLFPFFCHFLIINKVSLYLFLQGMMYHEQCNCPQTDTQKWMTEMRCPKTTFQQILKDLEPFPTINLGQMKEDSIREFGKHNAICHYSIISNQV